MKRIYRFAITLAAMAVCTAAGAERVSWLPGKPVVKDGIRLLDCSYSGPLLTGCDEVTAGGRWKVIPSVTDNGRGTTSRVYRFVALEDMDSCGVAVAFDRAGWSSDNYVMLPSAVYGGNRQRIVSRAYATGLDRTDYYRKDLALTSNPIPQLSPEFGAKSRLEITSCNVATPAMAVLDRRNGTGTIYITSQGIPGEKEVRDFGLIVEEAPDRSMASFVISAPGVRELKPEFIGFSPSPDRGIKVNKGDTLTVSVNEIRFDCPDVPSLLGRFMAERKNLPATTPSEVRNLIPMSRVMELMMADIDERYLDRDTTQYYCPENADWMSYGWIGGMMNSYPALALGDAEHLRRVANTFDFGLSHGEGKSGYFYDTVGSDGKVLRRDAAAAEKISDIALTRKNADMLYWPVKQLMLMKKQGNGNMIKPEWENRMRRLADAFVSTWKKHGTWGNYVNPETGDIAVYNTTGGAMAPAGLALASVYFNNPEYLAVAREGAKALYDEFAVKGFTSGGCGDILQNADSETAVALLTSLMTLAEVTGDQSYIPQAEALAALCSTWTVSYPYILPENTPLARLGADLTGAVWASTQNKHGAPGFCTQSGDALFKLYRTTGNELYADLLRDIIHAHAEGIQPNGKITERLTYCDADSRGSRGDGGQTGWNETNGAMMATEIPGIYINTDTGRYFVFDHVKVTDLKKKKGGYEMTLFNPTEHEATVTVFAENASQAAKPLGDNRFTEWTQKVTVKPGKSAKCRIK